MLSSAAGADPATKWYPRVGAQPAMSGATLVGQQFEPGQLVSSCASADCNVLSCAGWWETRDLD